MPSRRAIEAILRDLRWAIDMGKFQPVSRRKNLQTLAMLGLTWEDAKAEIYTLTTDDYFQGPSVDRNFPTSDRLWVFKKKIDGESIYIKFKVYIWKTAACAWSASILTSCRHQISEGGCHMYCPKCQSEVATTVRNMTESYPVKGENIQVDAQVRVCSVCGEALWDDVLDSQNLRRAYAKYREIHGLLQPEEIQEIRELYGLSQVVFARVLGLGDKTVARYENGSLADAAQNNLIALAKSPENFRQLLEMSRCRITAQDYETARNALEQVFRQVSYNSKQIYVIQEETKVNFKLNWGGRKYA